MKLYTYRGKRIRASDKNLIFNYAASRLVPLFLLVVFLFHCKQILSTDWSQFNLLQMGDFSMQINVPYLIFSVVIALAVCVGLAMLYHSFRIDNFKQLQHRQKLACILNA